MLLGNKMLYPSYPQSGVSGFVGGAPALGLGSPLVTLPKFALKGRTLLPGESLNRGEAIATPNGGVFVLQKEGNLVLYGPNGKGQHSALWWSHGHNTPAVRATMRPDGVLVMLDPSGKEIWASHNPSSGAAVRLVFQDDGNAVWYDKNGKAVQQTNTGGWHINPSLAPKGNVLTSIVDVVTAPVKAAASATEAVFTAPVKALAAVTSQIPVVGDITHIMSEATSSPIHAISQVAQGANISKTALGYVKDQIKVVKDAAPYAQTVISLVPGVGPGVSAAMGAGIALAEGKSIDEIAKAAIRSALPGGPLAAAAFDTALKVAAGGNVAKSVLEGARATLPPAAQKAFDIGLAVATGENIQNAVVNGIVSMAPAQLQALATAGEKAISSTPGMADVLKSITAAGGPAAAAATDGFKLASGLLTQSGVNEKAISMMRNRLTKDQITGFDNALKAQVKKIPWLSNVVDKPVDPSAVLKAVAAIANKPPALRAPPKAVPRPAAPPMRAPPVKAPVRAPAAAATGPRALAAPVLRSVGPVAPRAASNDVAPPAAAAIAPSGPAVAPAAVRANTAGMIYPPYPQQVGTMGLAGCGDPTEHKWSKPLPELSRDMHIAGNSAVNGSRGRPRMVEGPDGTYLFSHEGGGLVARKSIGKKR